MTAVADANGNILNTEFAPDENDLNIRCSLTASGSASEAQTTFTDGRTINQVTVNGASTVTVSLSASIMAAVTATTTSGINWQSTGWRI